ncbi:MAG: prohibitin family protein [Patescibacteria group bacterium]|jgi:prohibitin 2|nr:prohibitin family protein [Patescibacteria group bacterium]
MKKIDLDKKKLQSIIYIAIAIWIIYNILPFLAIVGVIIYIAYIIFKNKKMFDFKQAMGGTGEPVINVNPSSFMKKGKGFAWVIAVIIILVIIAPMSFTVIGAGETGVYSLFGKVKNKEMSSGFHLKNPLAKIDKMSIRTEEYTMSIMTGEGKKVGADSIAALTKEGLNVDLDITVLYHLDEKSASDVYEKVGLGYEEKIIRPEIRSSIREVISQYSAKELYSNKRQEAAIKIKEELAKKLDPRGIILEDVLLRNVQLPANLTQSIQEKLQAEQEAQKYDFLLQTEKKEKERKIIEAEGQRDAQTIINESLSDKYLNYLYVQNLESREGTIYVPTDPTSGLPMFKGIGQ